MTTSPRCAQVLRHLNRIQGQIESLKKAVEAGQSCDDVAMLTTSILRSFDSARASIVENYIATEILGSKQLTTDKANKLTRIISLYKA